MSYVLLSTTNNLSQYMTAGIVEPRDTPPLTCDPFFLFTFVLIFVIIPVTTTPKVVPTLLRRGCSSVVRAFAMVRGVIGSIFLVDPRSYFSFQPVLHDWKEGNVLFNDALNTFYLRLYGVRHMVNDHTDSER